MAPLRMNSTQGIPGQTNFRHKLPKYVTKASLSLAVFHLRQSFETLKKDINIEENEFIAQTLSRMLPSLNVDICKHFSMTSGLTPDQSPDESGGGHVGSPDAEERVDEEEEDEGEDECPDTMERESDLGTQCIWCNKLTESKSEKPLCAECVAIPSRIKSLEIRLEEDKNLTNNQTSRELNSSSGVHDPDEKDDTKERKCRICDRQCDEASFICMRCKCINNRLDQLSMDMKKVQHAIDAILDTPQRRTPPTQATSAAVPDAASSSQRGPVGVASTSRSTVPPGQKGTSSPRDAASSRERGDAFPPLPSQSAVNKRGPPPPQPAPPGTTATPHGPKPKQLNNFSSYAAQHRDNANMFPPPPFYQNHNNPLTQRWNTTPSMSQMYYRQPHPPFHHLGFGPFPQAASYQNGYPSVASYASVVRPPLQNVHGCENCGEPNHRAQNCRHGMKLQCHRCLMYGHKANACIY